MFHHDKSGKAKFGSGGSMKSAAKPEEKSMPQERQGGNEQAPHGQTSSEQHVTKTHPGMTQPHPTTGVHAFHGMHKGGGKYASHTHHEDGTVESREHPSAGDMHQSMHEALPQEGDGQMQENQGDGMDMSDVLSGGVGGDGSSWPKV